ncbi:tripartite tricarboxylate transporter permease [Nonomuraea sp. M3C6]|uniref:Tripartite tricarboxylate transporter permease n=1 Tax=Nonomuraea marmarensis TaxID=3351344 RepID=A0ABW7AKZ8_9ACTN
MSSVEGLMHGFGVALTPQNLLFALIGCLVGMLVGVLPGIGQSAGMALLIPLSYFLPPAGSIIMLASIFYGAAYGGRITSILMNVPGESESVVTAFDGYPMAQQGRAGVALSTSAIASFAGAVLSVVALAFAALPLSRLALHLGPPEYFSLMVLGLCLVVALIEKSLIKGVIMLMLGLFLSQIGTDPVQGSARFTLGLPELLGGIPLLAVIMGFFGVSDVLLSAGQRHGGQVMAKIERLTPGLADLRASTGPAIRGTVIGFVLGLIPGMVAAVSTFASYVAEKRVSKRPERFGRGAIQGVAGPETANKAFEIASFVPLFTLGIPGSAALAILLSAFLIQGVTPGPAMFTDSPDVAWGVIASMIVGNVILLVLNFPLVRMWVLILRIPADVLGVLVVVVSVVGIYSVNNSISDVLLLALFSVVGCLLKLLEFPLPPIVLAFVLGDRLEGAFRQSLVLTDGNPLVFFTRPISGSILAIAVIVMVVLKARRSPAGKAPTTPVEAP